MGEFGKIVNEACCSVLDMLQRFSSRGWESSQEGVTVVQTGDGQCLDQELRHIFCEERPDPVDVVEGKSAGSGHSSDVVVLRLLVIKEGHTMKSSTVTDRSMRGQSFPEFNFSKVEFEEMCSCLWSDVCQTLPDARCNMGVGGEW